MKVDQAQKVLNYLEEHKSINIFEAVSFNIFDLRAAIRDLRDLGYNIVKNKELTINPINNQRAEVSCWVLISPKRSKELQVARIMMRLFQLDTIDQEMMYLEKRKRLEQELLYLGVQPPMRQMDLGIEAANDPDFLEERRDG